MYEKHLLEPLCKISKRDIQAHSKKLTDNAMTKKMKRPNDEQQHTQIRIEKRRSSMNSTKNITKTSSIFVMIEQILFTLFGSFY